MIEFKNVTKVYDNNVLALSNLNIQIDKGEFVFLVGPSGAGKSTFIKMLLKEVDPTAGEVIIAGTNITKLAHKEVPFYRRKIGVVFQDFRLIPGLNVFENVAFALRVIGASEREIQKKVPSVLALVGLTKKRNAFPNQLSGGEQQRVSIARSIVNSPSILIADEPTGNLDPETSLEIMDIISDINRAGTTIVMATHAKDIVDTMKKRVIAIEKGTVARDEERGKYGYEI
ncbi:Cell division ATP-binding protein FtsE [bioreactor metagenome]|uniref:Cell division ATP-binding protein FtsE n=1 Tax=bioreactor metagenome TaxID=1076179 RepID=A0A645BBX3_9ZZZZ